LAFWILRLFIPTNAAGGSDALAGKVLLDINNPVDTSDFLAKNYNGISLSEEIAVVEGISLKFYLSLLPLV
jgi:hypothetical protein